MWNRKKRARVKELIKISNQASDQLEKQKGKVTAISVWLENRKNQNHFGLDFEYTLRPKRSR